MQSASYTSMVPRRDADAYGASRFDVATVAQRFFCGRSELRGEILSPTHLQWFDFTDAARPSAAYVLPPDEKLYIITC
ncbi:jg15777 [Pararge aegeria aegeria]|uniref:Jg15777 protein n=1 Tax=Pararge aegeria aegeria TaxID=348720 RepID=A0A8S4RL21_9NEOP|nr:jg15777 [Pararge aegeria aegeria]